MQFLNKKLQTIREYFLPKLNDLQAKINYKKRNKGDHRHTIWAEIKVNGKSPKSFADEVMSDALDQAGKLEVNCSKIKKPKTKPSANA